MKTQLLAPTRKEKFGEFPIVGSNPLMVERRQSFATLNNLDAEELTELAYVLHTDLAHEAVDVRDLPAPVRRSLGQQPLDRGLPTGRSPED